MKEGVLPLQLLIAALHLGHLLLSDELRRIKTYHNISNITYLIYLCNVKQTLRIFSCSSHDTLASSSSALILCSLSPSWCLSSAACRTWALAACRASTSAACSIISRSYLSWASAASLTLKSKRRFGVRVSQHFFPSPHKLLHIFDFYLH